MTLQLESNSFYEDQSFSNIRLDEGTTIVGTEFSDSTFKDCKFFKVSFFNCTFENCSFENCDLGSISLTHTSLLDVRFVDTKLTGIQWADSTIPLSISCKRCLLNYSGFIGVDLRSTDMSECQCKHTDFTDANLSKANCSYSDFSGARFINTNLTATDFTDAINYAIHPDGNTLKKTKFSLPEALSLLDVYDIIIK